MGSGISYKERKVGDSSMTLFAHRENLEMAIAYNGWIRKHVKASWIQDNFNFPALP